MGRWAPFRRVTALEVAGRMFYMLRAGQPVWVSISLAVLLCIVWSTPLSGFLRG